MKYLGAFVLLTAHINNNHGRVRKKLRERPIAIASAFVQEQRLRTRARLADI
jgi:hypothetical protein